MAENKTKATEISVDDFITAKVENEQMRKDSYTLIDLMQKLTGHPPKMWGPSIIGFDSYHYKYESGREGDICLVGFSPRKAAISLYLAAYPGRDEALKGFGKHKAEKGCIYVKKLSDIDAGVLEQMIVESAAYTKAKYA